MSIDFGAMLQAQTSLVQAQKTTRSWVQLARLGDKWETITISRNGVFLDPQVVRIEYDNTFTQSAESMAGRGFSDRGVIFGIKDHPTLPDLDVDEWDVFILHEQEYTIVQVNRTLLGQIQCQFEAAGS